MKDFLFLNPELITIYEEADINKSELSCAYESNLGSHYISVNNNNNFLTKKGLSVYLEGYCHFKDENKKTSSHEEGFLELLSNFYINNNNNFESLINHIVGIFTIVIIDDNKHNIFVASDYFRHDEQHTVITNNLSIYSRLCGTKKDISRDALCLLMRYNCIPAPYTIYNNVSKLSVGQFVQLIKSKSPIVGQYKDINQLLTATDDSINASEAIDKTEQALKTL